MWGHRRLFVWVWRGLVVALIMCGVLEGVGIVPLLIGWISIAALSATLVFLSLLLLRRMTLHRYAPWVQGTIVVVLIVWSLLNVTGVVPPLIGWLVGIDLFAAFVFLKILKRRIVWNFIGEIQEQGQRDIELLQEYNQNREQERE